MLWPSVRAAPHTRERSGTSIAVRIVVVRPDEQLSATRDAVEWAAGRPPGSAIRATGGSDNPGRMATPMAPVRCRWPAGGGRLPRVGQ